MKKIGSVNPCNQLALYDSKNNIIGYCLDTPNAFAKECAKNPNIIKGIAHYQYFKPTIRKREDNDNIDRMKMFIS